MYSTSDSNGAPIAFEFNGNFYYYVTNLQGDVIAILNSNGKCASDYKIDILIKETFRIHLIMIIMVNILEMEKDV